MTDQEINIAISEILGVQKKEIDKRLAWEKVERDFQYGTIGINEYYKEHLRVDPTPKVIVDYANDLNAMHEATKILKGRQVLEYVNNLWEVVAPGADWDSAPTGTFFAFINATARQRAEAFLRALNKWKD